MQHSSYKHVFSVRVENSVDLVERFSKCRQNCLSPDMRGSRKICQRGSNSDGLIYLIRGERIKKHNKRGQSSARQRNAIQMALQWRADDGPTLNAGLVAL